jgi:WD40 repeat protein
MISEGRPEQILQMKGHKEEIIALDLHPTCRYAVSTGQDSNFFVWDLKNQSTPRRFEGHKV